MRSEGQCLAYTTGREGIPLPTPDRPSKLPPAPKSPRPRGLDWSQHRAPDAAPVDPVTKQTRFTLCAECGRKMPQSKRSSLCDACTADVLSQFEPPDRAPRPKLRYGRKRQRADDELLELERADPVVAAAGVRLAETVRRITRPDDYVRPPNELQRPDQDVRTLVVDQDGNPQPTRDFGPPTPASIRAWAAANGYPVTGRGRLSREIHDAYERAHP